MTSKISTSSLLFKGSISPSKILLRGFVLWHLSSLNVSLSFACDRDKDATEARQEEPPALPAGVQGLGMGLPDLRSKKKGKQKVSKESHVSEALDKLREQTREAVKGLESVSGAKPGGGDDLGKDAMMEDWVKQFEELAGSQVMCL